MSDKDRIVEIISKSFLDNPRLTSTLKKGNTEQRIRLMALYAYNFVKKRDGIFLTSDKSTLIMYYRKSQEKKDLNDLLSYYHMFFRCIKLKEAWATYKREKYIRKQRLDLDDYIYVWVLAGLQGGKGLKPLAEIRDELFGLSRETQLPLIIETVMPKVLNLYKYVGFEIYNEWQNEAENYKLWFLKREPEKSIS